VLGVSIKFGHLRGKIALMLRPEIATLIARPAKNFASIDYPDRKLCSIKRTIARQKIKPR
jgi:hypothetical protein